RFMNGVALPPRFALRADRVEPAGGAVFATRRAQGFDADRILGVELVETFLVLPLLAERNVLLRDIQRGHGPSFSLVRRKHYASGFRRRKAQPGAPLASLFLDRTWCGPMPGQNRV